MSRQEKKTRMRLLPPKVQLQQQDALTGSYPTNVRFSLDGRIGNYKVDYNDVYTVNYTSSNAYIPSIGFAIDNIWLTNSQSNDLTSSIVTTGSVRSRIIEGLPYFHFSPGQEIQPFSDQLQYAADAKGASVQNPFFATGSAETLVGEGFNSPLWSKNKIEIPIPVVADVTLATSVGKLDGTFSTTYDSPMAYYNFAMNTWELIGVGLQLNVTSSVKDYYGYYPIGFPNGLFPNVNGYEDGNLSINDYRMSYCSTGLGFPFHPKFNATGSQVLDLSKYITEPFVLEKAVLQVGKVTYKLEDIDSTVLSAVAPISASCATFFILNQRYNQNYNYSYTFKDLKGGIVSNVSSSIPLQYSLTKDDYDISKTVLVDTVRDVIGFSQIYSVASFTPLEELFVSIYNPIVGQQTGSLSTILPITSNDILVRNQNPGYKGVEYYDLKPVFSMSMGSPSFSPNFIGYNIFEYHNNDYQCMGYDGYRNGLGMLQPTTRGLTNDLYSSKNIQPEITAFAADLGGEIRYPSEKYRINPYILNPKDKLILGCQIPISQIPVVYMNDTAGGIESTFKIHETVSENLPAKLVLYGSYIRENKEYNDGTNQLLSSETIHEVIE